MNETRDYLVEAQRIAAGTTLLLAQREHLLALVEWDKNLVAERDRAVAEAAVLLRVLESRELLEALAAVEHARWAAWMRYAERAPAEKRADWPRKAGLAYAEMTDAEQESDRIEARKSLAVIAEHMRRSAPLAAAAARVIECAEAWKDAPPAHAEGCPVGCVMCTLDGNLTLAVESLLAAEAK